MEYYNNPSGIGDSDLISVYDELPLWSAPFGSLLLDTVRLKKDIKILDIGCGTGFPLLELAQRFGKGSHGRTTRIPVRLTGTNYIRLIF